MVPSSVSCHLCFSAASAYSERYLGLPEDNFSGYEASSLVNGGYGGGERARHVERLFLVHGMADRNVHVQHSMILAKELIRHGVPFQQQVGLYYRDALKGWPQV